MWQIGKTGKERQIKVKRSRLDWFTRRLHLEYDFCGYFWSKDHQYVGYKSSQADDSLLFCFTRIGGKHAA